MGQKSGPFQSWAQALSRDHGTWKASWRKGTMMDTCPVCPFVALSEPPALAVCLALWDSWILCPVSGPLLLRTLGSVLVAQPAGSWGCLSCVIPAPSPGRVTFYTQLFLVGRAASEWPAFGPHPLGKPCCLPPAPPRFPLPRGMVLGSRPLEASSILPASWQDWHLGALIRTPWHSCPGCGRQARGGWSRQ